MADPETDMLINITASGELKKPKRPKISFSTNAKKRIQQRRQLKYKERMRIVKPKDIRKERQFLAAAEKSKLDKPHEKAKLIKTNNETNDGKHVPERVKRESKSVAPKRVISSLFKNNPEVPLLESSEVDQPKEVVFTNKKFSELPLHPHLISCLEEKMCLCDMTEVQRRAIPLLLAGQDVLVKSQTGSGKTLSYAVPLVQSLRSKAQKIQRADGLYAVILVPTRELALQTLAVIRKLLQSCVWIVPGIVIGGESKKSEKACLRRGVNVLVATPGRLVDHAHSTCSLTFHRVEWLIIDEADRLLDMGFEKDLTTIMALINKQAVCRQTILLSATLNVDIRQLASVALTNPSTVDVAAADDADQRPGDKSGDNSVQKATIPSTLQQFYVVVPAKLRLVALAAFILGKCLHSPSKHKLLVFLPTQEMVQFYFDLLNSTINRRVEVDSEPEDSDDETDHSLFELYALHGDMDQKYRSQVYNRFTKASSGVLLCTDVAARGLDLPHVDWIVQLSPPTVTESYIHRVGRTARIGSRGNALIFLMPSEVKYVEELNRSSISLSAMDIDSILKFSLLDADRLPAKSGATRGPRSVQEAATALQQSMEEYTYSEDGRIQQAKATYQSFIRSYATYPSNLKYIFHVKNLHLGHVAKSFCLREAPSGIGSVASGAPSMKSKLHDKSKAQLLARDNAKRRKLSEFASGM